MVECAHRLLEVEEEKFINQTGCCHSFLLQLPHQRAGGCGDSGYFPGASVTEEKDFI